MEHGAIAGKRQVPSTDDTCLVSVATTLWQPVDGSSENTKDRHGAADALGLVQVREPASWKYFYLRTPMEVHTSSLDFIMGCRHDGAATTAQTPETDSRRLSSGPRHAVDEWM